MNNYIYCAKWQEELLEKILAHDKKWSVPIDIKCLFPALK